MKASRPRSWPLAREANGGRKYLVTTSWYSGIGHIPGSRLRRGYFRQLGRLTARRGEMVMSVSATGDLAELQPEFSNTREDGDGDNGETDWATNEGRRERRRSDLE